GRVVRHRRSCTAARGGQPHAPARGAARARCVLPRVNAAILGARFLLELCLLAALAYAGLQVNVAAAILAPLAAAVVWGVFVSPKARLPPGTAAWIGIQLVLFGAASAGLVPSGSVGP